MQSFTSCQRLFAFAIIKYFTYLLLQIMMKKATPFFILMRLQVSITMGKKMLKLKDYDNQKLSKEIA